MILNTNVHREFTITTTTCFAGEYSLCHTVFKDSYCWPAVNSVESVHSHGVVLHSDAVYSVLKYMAVGQHWRL